MTNPASKIARFKRKLEDTTEEKPSKKQKTEEKKDKANPKEIKENSKKNSKKIVAVEEEPATDKIQFVLPEDDDFELPAKPPSKTSKAPPKPVRTYSRSERAKSRKRPEEEEKERLAVLGKFKNNSAAATSHAQKSSQTQPTETTDGVEKFSTEAPQLLTDEKPVISKSKPSPSNTNKGIFANAKYSKLIQKKGAVKDPSHKEENFIDTTAQYNPYNLSTAPASNNNLEKEKPEDKKKEEKEEKEEKTEKKGRKLKAKKETLEYVQKSRSELQEKLATPQKKLTKDILRLLNAINPSVVSESAEVELRASQSCVEASSRVLQSLNVLTDSLAMAAPMNISSDQDMFHGSVFNYNQPLTPLQSRSAPNLDQRYSSLNGRWSNQFLPAEPIQLETPPRIDNADDLFDPSIYFN